MKKLLTTLFALVLITTSAVAIEPSKQAIELYNQGIDLYQTGNVQKSIELFQSAISECPDFYEAYYNLAQIQFATNKLDDAIKTYEKIAELRPDDEENLYYLARSLYKKGYLSRAMSYYRQLTPECAYYDDAQVEMRKLSIRQEELRQEKMKNEQDFTTIQTPWVMDNVVKKPSATNTDEKKTDDKVINIQTFDKEFLEPKSVEFGNYKPTKIATIDGIKSPAGVAIDSFGNTYVASFSQNAIYKIDTNMNKTIFASGEDILGPVGVACDKFDNLYVANYSKGNILKISQTGERQEISTIKNPYFMTIKGEFLFVSEQVSNTVLKFKLY